MSFSLNALAGGIRELVQAVSRQAPRMLKIAALGTSSFSGSSRRLNGKLAHVSRNLHPAHAGQPNALIGAD
jgi:hypothetical protein